VHFLTSEYTLTTLTIDHANQPHPVDVGSGQHPLALDARLRNSHGELALVCCAFAHKGRTIGSASCTQYSGVWIDHECSVTVRWRARQQSRDQPHSAAYTVVGGGTQRGDAVTQQMQLRSAVAHNAWCSSPSERSSDLFGDHLADLIREPGDTCTYWRVDLHLVLLRLAESTGSVSPSWPGSKLCAWRSCVSCYFAFHY